MRLPTRRSLLLVGLLLGAGPLPIAETAPAAIVVTIYTDGEQVRHPVLLLRGTLPADARDVVATNESSQRDTRVLRGTPHDGRFLALAELVPGEHRLVVRAGAHARSLRLTWLPPTNRHVVRCIYLTDSTGDTAYHTQDRGAAQDFAGRLDAAMKLLQCFTAERMHDLGFGRVTFPLELDGDGRVVVHVLKGDRPAAAPRTSRTRRPTGRHGPRRRGARIRGTGIHPATGRPGRTRSTSRPSITAVETLDRWSGTSASAWEPAASTAGRGYRHERHTHPLLPHSSVVLAERAAAR